MHNITTPIKHIARASLVLALGTSLAACKDNPSHTRTATTDLSAITPTASGTQNAPVVEAGARQLADTNVTVFLSGSAIVADGATLASARWTQLAGPTVTLLSPDSLNTHFVSPTVNTTTSLVFQLVATDDQARSGNDTVRITINPLASALQVAGGTVSESAGEFSFTLNLPQAPAAPLTLRYSTRDGSAIAGDDYEAFSGELTLAAGTIHANLPTVRVLDDAQVEGNETLSLVVSTSVDGENVQATANLTILDDDAEGNPPTDTLPRDVVEAVLERQSFIALISDPNASFGTESLKHHHPILNRERSQINDCVEGQYTRNIDAGALPAIDRTVTETATDCQTSAPPLPASIQNGHGEFTLTEVSENFYESTPQAASFWFQFSVDWRIDTPALNHSISRSEAGWAHYENYDFSTQSGFREVHLESLSSSINGANTVHFDFAAFSVWQPGPNSASTQISGLFDTRVVSGALAGQAMYVELLSENRYNFGEDGLVNSEDMLAWNGQSYLLPISGRVRYRMGLANDTTATIVADYLDTRATLHIDLDGNGCVDGMANLAYQRDQTIPGIGILITDVEETTCLPLPGAGEDSPSQVDIVDGIYLD